MAVLNEKGPALLESFILFTARGEIRKERLSIPGTKGINGSASASRSGLEDVRDNENEDDIQRNKTC